MILAMAICYVGVHEDNSIPYRDVAMVKPLSKMEILGDTKKDNMFRHTRKIRGPMTLAWELVGEQPTRAGDMFELEAIFTTETYIENISAQLVVPPGVELVKGVKTFDITKLSPDQPQKMRFVLKQTSNRNEQVHLVANGSKGPLRFADSIQFNTFLEPLIKQEKETLLKNSMKEESNLNKVSF